MQAQSAKPVRTFAIGFHEKGYDEAQHAKAVATHLGTDHTELYVTAEDALAVVPSRPRSSRKWRGSTLPSRCPAMAATNSSAAIHAISA
ncbi:hypothetical protein G6F63_016583 [Rhizopus arrhizus]|uniref:Asparagine synthetase domain-containing protein n=1 Tax=Rhizopus oryzae TaxID=64495 RepID=A0A9P6WSQ4_RHIOR|nr:hypothetical protein G6F64_015113 [Rhizopus arrhizus]KAG1305756.1 hypothetical protein G6F63_016583 [Rhizopus arrhizus]